MAATSAICCGKSQDRCFEAEQKRNKNAYSIFGSPPPTAPLVPQHPSKHPNSPYGKDQVARPNGNRRHGTTLRPVDAEKQHRIEGAEDGKKTGKKTGEKLAMPPADGNRCADQGE